MSNSISYSYRDLWMVAALVCVAVVLGIYPADRTVWCIKSLAHSGCPCVLIHPGNIQKEIWAVLPSDAALKS